MTDRTRRPAKKNTDFRKGQTVYAWVGQLFLKGTVSGHKTQRDVHVDFEGGVRLCLPPRELISTRNPSLAGKRVAFTRDNMGACEPGSFNHVGNDIYGVGDHGVIAFDHPNPDLDNWLFVEVDSKTGPSRKLYASGIPGTHFTILGASSTTAPVVSEPPSDSCMSPQRREPVITINGVTLSTAQAMSVRVAVTCFRIELADPEYNQGLGESGPLYDERLSEVELIMRTKSIG